MSDFFHEFKKTQKKFLKKKNIHPHLEKPGDWLNFVNLVKKQIINVPETNSQSFSINYDFYEKNNKEQLYKLWPKKSNGELIDSKYFKYALEKELHMEVEDDGMQFVVFKDKRIAPFSLDHVWSFILAILLLLLTVFGYFVMRDFVASAVDLILILFLVPTMVDDTKLILEFFIQENQLIKKKP